MRVVPLRYRTEIFALKKYSFKGVNKIFRSLRAMCYTVGCKLNIRSGKITMAAQRVLYNSEGGMKEMPAKIRACRISEYCGLLINMCQEILFVFGGPEEDRWVSG